LKELRMFSPPMIPGGYMMGIRGKKIFLMNFYFIFP
jgi:hypothetical protein